MNTLPPGTQIIYVPGLAHGDKPNADCETGFVERDDGSRFVACRFWRKGSQQLRTIANGEACRRDTLVIQNTVPQEVVAAVQESLVTK